MNSNQAIPDTDMLDADASFDVPEVETVDHFWENLCKTHPQTQAYVRGALAAYKSALETVEKHPEMMECFLRSLVDKYERFASLAEPKP